MKKMLQWSLGFLVVMVALALVVPAGAATTNTKTPAKKHTTPYWTVSSADATANTIELQQSDGSSNLTLKVTAATKITVGNKPGKIADLQKGQKATFTASGENCTSITAVAVADTKKKK
jgi:hypothetical protein